MFNSLIRMIVEAIKKIPGVMRLAFYCERRFSNSWSKVLGFVSPVSPVIIHKYDNVAYDDLSPRIQKIYADLKTAIDRKKKAE